MAPPDGLEPPTQWLIPPSAGLYRLNILEIPFYPTVFNLLFEYHGIAAGIGFSSPDDFPWPNENLGGPARSVFGIVVLAQPSVQIVRVTAIVSSTTFALNDIGPKRHRDPIQNPASLETGFCILAPPDGLEPPTQWLTATCSTS